MDEIDSGPGNVRTSDRVAALDHLRGFVIALVVFHHSILAYCWFGQLDRRYYLLSSAPIVDTRRWEGFDVIVLLNDSFFMPLMFLISGLFVWPSLKRKGIRAFMYDRAVRLGLPFAAAVFTLVPIAYYPSWLETGGAPGFGQFWIMTVTNGAWPSGPPWFIALLLSFNIAAALGVGACRRLDALPAHRITFQPGRSFCLLLLASFVVYLPPLMIFGPSRWVSLGPIAVQVSRVGLYLLYFTAGISAGAQGVDGVQFKIVRAFTRAWPIWALLSATFAVVLVVTASPEWHLQILHGTALIVFCAATCFALLGLFQRLDGKQFIRWSGLSPNSYGIFLLHFPICTWLQYRLLQTHLTAVFKAAIVFALTLGLSWVATILLRRVAWIARII